MSNWEETVMSDEQIGKIVYPDEGSWTLITKGRQVAKAQAEISFSKGVDEEVKWGYGKGKEAGIKEVGEE